MYCQQDIELVQRLKEHDLGAYDIIYLKYYKMLCVNAYFFLKNEQESKDLVQNLFLDIWEKKLYRQFHDDLKGYLFQAIKNRCLNQLEKWQTQQKARKGYAGLQEVAGESYPEIQPEYGQQLSTALDNMPTQKKNGYSDRIPAWKALPRGGRRYGNKHQFIKNPYQNGAEPFTD